MFSAVNAKSYKETFLFCESLDFKENVRPGFLHNSKNYVFNFFFGTTEQNKMKTFQHLQNLRKEVKNQLELKLLEAFFLQTKDLLSGKQ